MSLLSSEPLPVTVATLADVDELVSLAQSAYRGQGSKQGWTTEADLLDGQRTDPDSVRALITGQKLPPSSDPFDSVLTSFSLSLADPNSVVLALRDETGKLIASCNIALSNPHGHALEGPRSAYFGLFSVSPALQNAGIGKKMMTAAEEYARTTFKATTMQMTVCVPSSPLGWKRMLTARTASVNDTSSSRGTYDVATSSLANDNPSLPMKTLASGYPNVPTSSLSASRKIFRGRYIRNVMDAGECGT